MVIIIDYGVGNLRSVQKSFEHLGAKVSISSNPEEVCRADQLVLPGVGAFRAGMEGLQQRNLVEPILQAIKKGTPFLGICLGMQLLLEESEEGEQGLPLPKGLGIIPGRVVRLKGDGLLVPHMGWNQVNPVRELPIVKSLGDNSYAYFVHSYYCEPSNETAVIAKTEYGKEFCSILGANAVWGIQFHPEKSQAVGLKILQGFLAT
jgi:imidazole glycerol-phosphate synthase subunit HisH